MSLTRIPGAQVPVLENTTGLMSREWYRFFYNLFQLTGGGGTDITPAELQAEVTALNAQVGLLNTEYAQVNQGLIDVQNNVLAIENEVNASLDGVTYLAEAPANQQINPTALVQDAALSTVQQEISELSKAVQDARLAYLSNSLDTLSATVNGLGMTPLVPSENLLCFGSFYDTTTQTTAAINTATLITFNSVDTSAYGVYRGSTTSRIYVTTPGTYNLMFSAQLDNTAGGNHLAYIWYRVNGTDAANSASQVRLKGTDGELVAAWNFFITLAAGDYVELVWAASDTAVQITAQAAAAPVPAIPSVILTLNQISSPCSH